MNPPDPNHRWSLDFVSDTLTDDRRFRILCVINDFSRECLTGEVDNSLSGVKTKAAWDARMEQHREDHGLRFAVALPQ